MFVGVWADGFVGLCVCAVVRCFICLIVCLPACLFGRLPFCFFVGLFVLLLVCMFVRLLVVCLCLFVFLLVWWLAQMPFSRTRSEGFSFRAGGPGGWTLVRDEPTRSRRRADRRRRVQNSTNSWRAEYVSLMTCDALFLVALPRTVAFQARRLVSLRRRSAS